MSKELFPWTPALEAELRTLARKYAKSIHIPNMYVDDAEQQGILFAYKAWANKKESGVEIKPNYLYTTCRNAVTDFARYLRRRKVEEQLPLLPDLITDSVSTDEVLPIFRLLLTPQESEVLDFLLAGHTAEEISYQLCSPFQEISDCVEELKTKLASFLEEEAN